MLVLITGINVLDVSSFKDFFHPSRTVERKTIG
jgi:hypothetical protein